MGKKRKRKVRKTKTLFFLILLVIGLSILYIFHQEIFNYFKSFLISEDLLKEKKEVILYFSDSESEYLVGEKREIVKDEDIGKEVKEMIIELTKGPKGKLIPTLPLGTKLLTFQLDEKGLAKVNFNRSLSKDHPGGSSAEIMTVYSIVNSLILNFPKIKKVQILIEGKEIETIAGHLALKSPISSKRDLIRKE